MLAAIEHRSVDRLPTDIWATPEAWSKLEAEFGDRDTAMTALHIDGIASLGADYAGPPLPPVPDNENVDFWGMRRRSIQHHGGSYMEQYFHPLATATTTDDLDAYAWPQADWFDYSGMKARGEEAGRHQIVRCGYMAPFYYHNLLRGLEQSLVDPLLNPELTHEIVRRICDFFYDHHRRMFEACPGLIDIAQVTDDLGSQTGPLVSMALYLEFYAVDGHLQQGGQLDCHAVALVVLERLLAHTLGQQAVCCQQWCCAQGSIQGGFVSQLAAGLLDGFCLSNVHWPSAS